MLLNVKHLTVFAEKTQVALLCLHKQKEKSRASICKSTSKGFQKMQRGWHVFRETVWDPSVTRALLAAVFYTNHCQGQLRFMCLYCWGSWSFRAEAHSSVFCLLPYPLTSVNDGDAQHIFYENKPFWNLSWSQKFWKKGKKVIK